MANEHVIDVKARADFTALSKGLADAEKDLGKAGTGFSKYGEAAGGATKATQGFVEKNRGHMETVGKDAMIMGGAILAGIGLAVHAYAEFSGRMAQVQSLSHAGAGEMDALTKSALSMGTAFGLSANDVADAEIELVKAGVSVKEMIGGALPGALALAAAGQIDVGKATEIATIALTQFNLKGKDVPHVADLLAAGADKALGGVSELGDGLKQGGLIASQFGLTIDDTVGTLSAFANAGLLGSDAGTSMKTMFLALASPSKQAQKALDEYNITAYDSKGAFIGVAALAGQLHDKLGPLSDAQRNAALSTIFGTDAMRSAAVLMKEGSTGIRKWISDVNDQGFAAVQAAGKMDSLSGDFKKLQAAFQTGLIEMGAASDGFLRPVVKGLTDAIGAFNSLPEPVKGAGLAIAGVAGAGMLLGGALLNFIPKLHDSIAAFKALSGPDGSPRVASALGTVAKAAGVAAGALVALQVASAVFSEKHVKSAQDYGQAILGVSRAAGANGGAKLDSIFGNFDKVAGVDVSKIDNLGDAVSRLTHQTFNDAGNKFFQGFTDFIGLPKGEIGQLEARLNGLGDAMGNLVKTGGAEVAAKSFKQLTTEFERNGKGAKEALDYLPGYRDALKGMASELKVPLTDQELLNLAMGKVPKVMLDAQKSTEGQAKMAELAAKATEAQQKALDDLGISAGGAILNLDKLVTSMIASGLITLSARDAARNFEKSLDDLDVALAKNGTTLDITTQKGRDNQAALDGIAGAGLRSAEAMAKAGATQPEVQAQLQKTYDSLILAAGKFGITGDEADGMARKVMGIPKDVPINTAIQNYADTMAKAAAIKKAVEDIRDYKAVSVHVQYTESGTAIRDRASDAGWSNMVQAHADGGAIYGAGAKGVDSVRAILAPGEHVLTDEDVDAMGGQAAVYAFRKQLHNGGVRPSYATAAPSQAWVPAATHQNSSVVNADFTINQVDDPIGTSHAITRRLSALSI